MPQVKLRKALQIKNRLAGEISNLNRLIEKNNSHQVKEQPERFNVKFLIIDRQIAVNRLIAVKTALAKANVEIYEKIATLAELKSEIDFYRKLNTNEGTIENRYGINVKEVTTIVAEVNAATVEEIVKDRTLQIEKLQDEIDYFNSVTEIDIPV
jgi:hypothetical protein